MFLYKMVCLQIMLYEILYPSTLDASDIFWKKTGNTWENVYDTGPSKPTAQTRHSPSCCASALKNTCLNPQEEAGCSAAR